MQKASLLADNFLLLLFPHLCVFWSTSLTYHYNDVCWLHRKKNKSNHMLLCNRIWLIYFERSGPTKSRFERHSKMKFLTNALQKWYDNTTKHIYMKLTFFFIIPFILY
jgi:hypothetical protein